MKERPILMNAPMVRATLDGTKTQTRRIMQPQPSPIPNEPGKHWWPAKELSSMMRIEDGCNQVGAEGTAGVACPRGGEGDHLWVREAWRTDASLDSKAPREFSGWPVKYEADGAVLRHGAHFGNADGKIRVSIHMPRWASRILLEIVSVRVERLNDISEADCWAEGIEAVDGQLDDMAIFDCAKRMDRPFEDAAPTFAALWESINGAGSWDANPFVWAITFKRVAT